MTVPADPAFGIAPAQAAPGSPTDWALIGLIAYALVGAGWFAFTFARHLRFRRTVIRDSDPVSLQQAASAAKALGLRRVPELRLAHDATGPLTFGWLRPVVVLPAGATETFSPAELSHILLHEFAHAKRGDLLAAHAARLKASGEYNRELVACSRLNAPVMYTVQTSLGEAAASCTPRPATIEDELAALMASPDLDMRSKKAKARGMMAGHMRREWMDANPNPTPQQTFESCLAKIDFLNRNYRYEGHDYDPDATAKTCEKYRPG